jgi:4,5-dihydroxyphthalate decarboxylase
MTETPQLTLACGDYDRTRPLVDGRVTIKGGNFCVQLLPVGEMLAGAARGAFDVVEHSLATILMQSGADSPYVPIPVFPSRVFRHNGIYVRTESSFSDPAQLAGGRIGITGYTVTAMVWMRGILADHHGLPIDAVSYVNGGLDAPGAPPMRGAIPPDGVVVEEAPDDTTLCEMLAAGDLEAIYALHTPDGFHGATPSVRRLFPDVQQVEREYFKSTGIFPLMHVLAVRREVYEANPWIEAALTSAFQEARELATHDLADTSALRVALPWVYKEMEEVIQLLGADYWSDGIAHNVDNLRAFARYALEQGLVSKMVEPEELFRA